MAALQSLAMSLLSSKTGAGLEDSAQRKAHTLWLKEQSIIHEHEEGMGHALT